MLQFSLLARLQVTLDQELSGAGEGMTHDFQIYFSAGGAIYYQKGSLMRRGVVCP